MTTLVISHYEEDLSWTKSVNKDISIVVIEKKPENIGRESHAYFKYIIENYDNLSGKYIFCQGNPFDHCRDFITKVNMGTPMDFIQLSTSFITNNIHGLPHHPFPLRGDIVWKALFDTEIPSQINFGVGAQFIVSADVIKGRDLAFYKSCYDIHCVIDEAPWIFERIWGFIFESKIIPKCKKYFTVGMAVGDTLISMSFIKKFAEHEKDFGIICFPNKEFFSEKDFYTLLKNIPESSENIMLSQEQYVASRDVYWRYAICKRSAWEHFINDLSYYSGIPSKYIWPTCPRKDYFESSFEIKMESDYRVNFDRYILFNPVSTQSAPPEQHNPIWKDVLHHLCDTKIPVVVVSLSKLDLSFEPRAINITGKTKSVMDDMNLAKNSLFTITTANNMSIFCHFNKVPHMVMQTQHFSMGETKLFLKWMAKEDYSQLKYGDSIEDFDKKLKRLYYFSKYQ